MSDEDFKKADEFIKLMRILYTSTLAVSSEKTLTCGQILTILKKLETHFTAADDDSVFTATIKAKIWSDLSGRYQVLIIHLHYSNLSNNLLGGVREIRFILIDSFIHSLVSNYSGPFFQFAVL